jgi:hydroxymethylbilane synthase
MTRTVRVGTRGSKLALAQTNEVTQALLSANPSVEIEVIPIRTGGDRSQSHDLASIGVGVFVKEVENALLNGEVDIAVHSMKDLVSTIEPELVIAAVPYREDPRDAMISRSGAGLEGLPPGARVATGSARRRALLLEKRPDLHVEPIRGNVPTRLEKLDAPDGPDALMLAAAGLKRLGLSDRITSYLACWDFISAVGQGALAIETRAGDTDSADLVKPLDYPGTHTEVDAERAFLAAVRGGCSAPVSAHARARDGRISIHAFASDRDGKNVIRGERSGDEANAIALATDLAEELLARGASELVATPGSANS